MFIKAVYVGKSKTSSIYLRMPLRFCIIMAMKLTNSEKKQTWIVGVSGGSDSMALLDMCKSLHMHVIAAHMNYQKRKSADRDMEGVRQYCMQHHIPCEIRLQQEPCDTNFQAFAREKRYAFFHELTIQYQAAGILIAHQKDDVLETYQMQIQRQNIPNTYGLCDHVQIYGCQVVRPLLSYTKKQLECYCQEHDVPYFLDESNLSDRYTRNRIRHSMIDNMSETEKNKMIEEIKQKNQDLACIRAQSHQFLNKWNYQIEDLLAQSYIAFILDTWIYQTCHVHVSQKEIQEIITLIQRPKNATRKLTNEFELIKQYHTLSIQSTNMENYTYIYDTLLYETTPYFSLQKTGDVIEGVTLCKEDFPITIRSYQPGDQIQLRFGTKKISRWFIDRKIPQKDRKQWPVMVNSSGKIIFVSKIGCDIAHFSNNPSVFVIK